MSTDKLTGTGNAPEKIQGGVYIIIPAYNEVRCIKEVLSEICASYPTVVVVDDGSTDGTFEAAIHKAAYVLRHVVNRGQGAALQTGIDFALARGARFIVSFDADGQHCVEDVQALLAPIRRGECDITLGSRFLGEKVDMPASRRLILRLGVWFTRIVSRVKVTDTHNGLRAFSRRAAERINITLDRMAHASELVDQIRRSGLRFREVPVRIRYSKYSLGKGQSGRNAIRILIHYFTGRILP